MPLKSDEAQKVVAAAHAKAREMGIKVTVAVVDEGGYLVWLGRMDGAPPMSPQVAEAKAAGCAWTTRDGAAIAQIHQDRPGFFAVVKEFARLPLVPGLGSCLIKRGDSICGAVGVSGGKPEQDLDCCTAGLAAL